MSLALFIRRGLDPDSRPICIYRHPENKENISPDNLPLSHLLCLYDLRNCISLQGKQNSFEMKVWRTSLRSKVRTCVQESQTPRTAVCLGRFALLRQEQGTVPLAPLCGYPPKAKGVTTKVTPFAYYTVLRTPRLIPAVLF